MQLSVLAQALLGNSTVKKKQTEQMTSDYFNCFNLQACIQKDCTPEEINLFYSAA